ncbi:hypothetical protein GCM10020295_08360 [Streptomyces cinereospinus]
MDEERARRFDLSRPLLFRMLLVRLGAARGDRLVVGRHLILWDGWSAWLFLDQLFALYESGGDPAGLARPGSYRDYLTWLERQDGTEATRAWRAALAGFDEPTLLVPAVDDRGLQPVIPEHLDAVLAPAAAERLRDTARRHGLTPNTVLNAAWGLVLASATGRSDIVFGTTVAGRPSEVPDVENVIGMFLNTVPARIALDPREPVLGLLRRIQGERLELMPHEYLGLGVLQAETGHRRLFDTLFVLRNADTDERLAALRDRHGATAVANVDATHYPANLVVTPGERVRVTLAYRPDLLDEAYARGLLDRFVLLVDRLVADPAAPVGSLDALLPAEAAALAREEAGRRQPVPHETVADMLAAQAARTPDATALVCGARTVTYAELDARCNRMARLLIARGARPETVVALGLPRSIDTVVALFAVLRTGAAYLPLELDHPAERLSQTLADARPLLLLSTRAVSGTLTGATPRVLLDAPEVAAELAGLPADPVHVSFSLDHPAYVIYTSGSTGRPKGVVTPYAGLTNMQLNHQKEIFAPAIAAAGGRRLRIAHTVSFAFDMSWEELLWLVEGHEVHICDEELRRDATALVAYCEEHRVDVVNVTPTYAHLLIEEGLLEGAPAAAGAARRRGGHRGGLEHPAGHRGDVRLQSVRAHRVHHQHPRRRHPRQRHTHRGPPDPRHPGPRPGPLAAAGAGRRGGRAVHRRRGPGPRLPRPAGADGRAVRGRPPRAARRTRLPHRRPGAPAARRQPGLPRPHRRPGQDPRPPGGARRDRDGARAAPRGVPGRRRRPRRHRRPRHQAPGRLRRPGRPRRRGRPAGRAGADRRVAGHLLGRVHRDRHRRPYRGLRRLGQLLRRRADPAGAHA